jgi:stearoyl-CoA desaturase (Delta-9 desaturase)
MALAPAPANSDDVEPAANQTRDRLITGVVTVAPVVGLGFVAWQVWGDWLHRGDLVVFAILYLTTGRVSRSAFTAT